MNPCEPFQAQLLDHLYGLLDEVDSQGLSTHLESCVPCRTALTVVEGQRQLLAAAAKAEFPGVSFQAPQEVAPPAEPTMVVPIKPAPAVPVWARWAIAAGVLLTVGVAGGWTWQRYSDLRHGVELAQAKRGDLAKAKEALLQEQRDQEQRNQDKIRAIQDEINKLETSRKRRRLKVRVVAPETIQAGARNQVTIHTENLVNEPVPADVDVRLRNEKDRAVVFEKKGLRSLRGQCQLILPPNLQQPPGTRFDLEVVAKRRDNGARIQVEADKLRLVAPLYLTHLATDKPMYQPGEEVFFRSLTLERYSLKPVGKPVQLQFRITDPTGAEVFRAQGQSQLHHGPEKFNAPVLGPDKQPIQGIGTGSYPIPANRAGGVYTLAVTVTVPGEPGLAAFVQEQERKFIVNKYEKPRLNKELEFTRKSFGAGEEVVAACRVARVEGGKPLANQKVEATVQVDGKTYDAAGKIAKGKSSGIALRTDARGTVNVRFKLPAKIKVGEASLSIQFSDGGNHETLVRPIPLVLKKLQVEFFPEGGDLVAGVANRVYFQARTLLGKPAELKGRIVDDKGKEVVRVQTLHDDKQPGANQGMGVVAFTPDDGRKYELKIDSPPGIESRHVLPKVQADGVVLSIPRGVVGDNIPLVLRNGKTERKLLVGAYCRGKLLAHETVTAKENEEVKLDLKPQAGAAGVYRVTVFEAQEANRFKPLAERLLYRKPTERVDLTISADKKTYTPGERVRLSVTAVDEKQQPMPAILLVAVVDKSVLTLADEKTFRSMPAHFFLTTEVRGPEDLEYADFLVSDHPLAERALDLLLGTQGWRRFAEQQDPKTFQKKAKSDAVRLVRASGLQPLPKGAFAQPEILADKDEFQPKIVKLQGKTNAVQQAGAQATQQGWQEVALMEGTAKMAELDTEHATEKVDNYLQTVGMAGLLIVAGLLGIAGVVGFVLGVIRISRSQPRADPYIAVGVCSMMLFAVMTVVVLSSFGGNKAEQARSKTGNTIGAKAGGRNEDKAVALGADMDEGLKGLEKMPKEMKAPGGFGGGKGAAEAEKAFEKPAAPDRAMLAEGKAGIGQGRPPALARLQGGPNADALRKNLADGLLKKEQLDQQMDFRGGQPRFLAKDKKPRGGGEMALDPKARDGEVPFMAAFAVREYAHRHIPAKDNVRTDFAETLYWHPVLVLADGKGEAAFNLCDSVTTFQVQAFAHTLDGRLGAVTTTFVSRLPFTLQPKMPIEVTSSDQITIPLSITNATDVKRSVKVQVEARGLKRIGGGDMQLDVEGDKSVRRLFEFQPDLVEGQARLLFKGLCAPFAEDNIERTFNVVPDGFPIVGAHSGLLEKSDHHAINLPKAWVKGTMKLQVQVYPSTLADLQKGLESLLREPGGCFEQSSTSNYPNVLILNYLKESDQTNPDLVRRCRQLLDSGYQKLTSFECLDPTQKKQGYEWFGGAAPPHEALTAYGLLQFRDMAHVFPVDKTMLQRTRNYLMGQKDGKGGFKKNPRALDTFGGAPEHITNAYIVWSLTESGKEDNVTKELAALAEKAKTSKDPYFLALVANSLLNRDKSKDGLALLKALVKIQKDDGHLDGAETSITRSGGVDLQIETTALTVLAWLKANRPEFNPSLQKAVKWIGKQRGGYGGFGSTQSTILALKALIAHTKANKQTAEKGELILYVNDKEVDRKAFPAGTQDVLAVSVPKEDLLRAGAKNKVRVEITGKNVFPYTLSWSYRTMQPANGDKCPVHLSTKFNRDKAAEADTVRLTATVANKTGKGQGMAVAIIGLPGGLTLPEDMKQIKEYVRPRDKAAKAGDFLNYISAFEVRGRELVLYWRDLGPEEKIQVNLDLICRVPGSYRGPASRAYLYYDAAQKFWTEPLAVAIAAKE